jgi:hypothetical protein
LETGAGVLVQFVAALIRHPYSDEKCSR